MSHKKILVFALLIAAALVWLLVSDKNYFKSRDQDQRVPDKITRTEVPADQVPEGFPSEVPIEAGAKITQNFEADLSSGSHQSTRAFESKKTVAQNYALYTDFLTKNGWAITAKSESADLSSIFAEKNDSQLAVNISRNKLTSVVTVDLSFVK